MAVTYGKKKHRQNNIVYTLVTALLLGAIFFSMVGSFYRNALETEYNDLHIKTKQIKDDISLQLLSDRENLMTMASFAAKLYGDGESYDIMFESFKPIGLIENIGILNPDNVFVTKAGSIDLDGLISFEEEAKMGEYISGRVKDLTRGSNELIRSAVPIISGGKTVGILYGVIKLDKIGERYKKMADAVNAQLFVYDRETGNLVIDTVHEELGNISFLKDRKYNENYSYEQMMASPRGFTSFLSAYRNENLHLHYSSMDDIGWMIALGKYDSEVFADTESLAGSIAYVFLSMLAIVVLYILILMLGEKQNNDVTSCASEVRKELLGTIDGQNNIFDALVLMCGFAKSNSAMFFDSNGEDYNYILPKHESVSFLKNDRHYFKTELFRYVSELYKTKKASINVMCIKPNKHLQETNPAFYKFLKKHKVNEISFAAIVNTTSHIALLGTVNSKNGKSARLLMEKVVACFSMALYNKQHIDETEIAATTDALTGVLNRVSYRNDLATFDEEQAENFSCIYVDVNGLHILNNQYGHAAGDEMLLYVANALKDIFNGNRIYRIGGDEFVVFVKNTEKKVIKKKIALLIQQLKLRNYSVSIGTSFREKNTSTDEMIREAEVKMYEEKTLYYQEKEKKSAAVSMRKDYVQIKTGILEIDTILSIMNENYNGIYRVSLDDDKARRILMPAYLGYNENEEHFSGLFFKYIYEFVDPDYHRVAMSFLNYDALRHQLAEGKTPKIRYKKIDGENVALSVYRLEGENDTEFDTLWVFAKK